MFNNTSPLFRSLSCAALTLLMFSLPASSRKKDPPPAKAAAPAPKISKPAGAPSKPAASPAHVGTAGKPAGSAGNPSTNSGVTTSNRGLTTNNRGVTTTNHGPNTTGPRLNSPGPNSTSQPHTDMGRRPVNSAAPNRTIHTSGGAEVRMGPHGPASVRVPAHNMEIRHGLNGHRQVVVERPDHSRVVVMRGGRGFVERPYQYRGRDFVRRSYYSNGRVYDRYYGRHYYRGVYVNYYTPAAYYRPAFYGWVYNPWVAPVPYGWGWTGSPWYGYYGAAYFTPYPVYPSASFWLTDYLVSASLAAAYEAQVAQAQQVALQQGVQVGAYGLAPDVKDLISAEVQRQIVLENSEAQNVAIDSASSSIERLLADGVPHIFVAGHELDVTTSTGLECAVSQGDTFQLAGRPPVGATEVSLIVLSSKGGIECHRSAVISVQLADLQEMQNYMRELIDQGLGELQSKQGRGTLPPLPASAAGEPIKATLTSVAPPPDANVGSEINQQLQTADAAENEALNQTPQTAPIAQPLPAPTISLGEGIDEVTVALGQPERIADLGEKKIYVYKDMKITFKNGSVSSVQ